MLNINISNVIAFILITIIWSALAIIARLLRLEKKRGIVIYPLFFMIKSEKFKKYIKRLAYKYRRFWRTFEKISLRTFPIVIVFSIIYLSLNFFLLLKRRLIITSMGIPIGTEFTPVIPFITIDPRIMLILLFSSFLAILPHEIAHGAVGVNNGIEIKSAGFFLIAGAISGGFIEIPEEILNDVFSDYQKSLMNSTSKKYLIRAVKKTLSAGTIMNALLLIVFFGFLSSYSILMSPFFKPAGILIVDVIPHSPAYKANLTAGTIIWRINDTMIKTIDDFRNFLANCKPNQTLFLYTNKGVFKVKLGKNNGRAFLGIYYAEWYESRLWFIPDEAYYIVFNTIYFNYLLQFIVIVLNAAPLFVNDGAKYLWIVIRRYKRLGDAIYQAINLFSLCILILTILGGRFLP